MAGKRRRKRAPARLSASLAGAIPETVPTRWVKFFVGLFLLPPAWVLTQTFFTAFARTTVRDAFWLTEEFWFFSLGVLLWLVAFFGLPRPLRVYVFGHELTHAVWVWMMGGRVHKFRVTWAFHLSFTCWMIPKGQPDLTYGGTFFSLIFIYTLNLSLLVGLLILASPGVTCHGFLRDFFGNAAEFSHQILRLAAKF